MNKKNFLLIALLILGLFMTVVGCGSEQNNANNNENIVSSQVDEQAGVRLLEDHLGRKVEIPNQPQRVLVLNSSMTEMVMELGVIPVGKVSEYAIPRPETKDLAEISFENSPNIEVINQLAPDLIFAHVRNHGQILDSLEASGAAVFYIDPNEAEDQLIGSIELIGEVLNRQSEAAAHIKKVRDEAERLKEILTESPIKTALLIQGGDQAVRAAQNFCFWGRLLYFLGIENILPEEVAKTTKAGFVNFDIETVIEKDPDALLVLQPGFRSVSEGNQGKGNGGQGSQKQPTKNISPEELLAMYRNDPMWQQLSAVKNGHIYIVPGNVSPGRIGTIDALKVMAGLLMPETI